MSGFEEWFENKYEATFQTCINPAKYIELKDAYNVGVAAERERCARLADEYHHRDPVHFIANAIAAAIRRG